MKQNVANRRVIGARRVFFFPSSSLHWEQWGHSGDMHTSGAQWVKCVARVCEGHVRRVSVRRDEERKRNFICGPTGDEVEIAQIRRSPSPGRSERRLLPVTSRHQSAEADSTLSETAVSRWPTGQSCRRSDRWALFTLAFNWTLVWHFVVERVRFKGQPSLWWSSELNTCEVQCVIFVFTHIFIYMGKSLTNCP